MHLHHVWRSTSSRVSRIIVVARAKEDETLTIVFLDCRRVAGEHCRRCVLST